MIVIRGKSPKKDDDKGTFEKTVFCEVRRGEAGLNYIDIVDDDYKKSNSGYRRFPAMPDGRRLPPSKIHFAGERLPDGNSDKWWDLENSFLGKQPPDIKNLETYLLPLQNSDDYSYDYTGALSTIGLDSSIVDNRDSSLQETTNNEEHEDLQTLMQSIETKTGRIAELEANLATALNENETLNKEIQELRAVIKEKTAVDINAMEQNSYDKGYAEAKEKYDRAFKIEEEDYKTNLEETLRTTRENIDEINNKLKDVDRMMPMFILDFVREIIGVERKINDKLILNVIRNNLEKLENFAEMKIVVNPADMDTVQETFPEIPMESSPEVTRGGFRVETNVGEVDFTIESLLEGLRAQIYESLE